MYEFVARNYAISQSVSQTISGKQLNLFLDLCFERSQYFSLNTARWTNSIANDFRTELAPFLVKQFQTQKWFGYDCSLDPFSPNRTMEIQVYKTAPETKIILLNFFADIFLNEDLDGELIESTQDVEDLCFLSNNKILVATVSHEHILVVNFSDVVFIETIKKMGKWIFREDNSSFPFLDQEIIV